VTAQDAYPSYAELLAREDAPKGSAWGVFGADDEIGTLNFITPDTVASACALVRRGAVFTLDAPLNSILPWRGGGRRPAEHHITKRPGPECDDWVDALFLQQSSQIDGLRHRGHPEHGFYNRTMVEQIEPGTPTRHPALGRTRHRRAWRAARRRACVRLRRRHLQCGRQRADLRRDARVDDPPPGQPGGARGRAASAHRLDAGLRPARRASTGAPHGASPWPGARPVARDGRLALGSPPNAVAVK